MTLVARAPLPLVTVILPCRDEANFIASCLASVLANDYPAELVELLVVDGMSTDGTRDILCRHIEASTSLTLLDNDRHIIPAAMNIGIRAARGDIILKIDAHSTYPSDYISKCVRLLQESGADNVGGVLFTEPSAETAIAGAIAIALAHPFGSGNSRFRIGSSQPLWADTAAFGCYRRDVFDRIGFYNEKLVRSSDMDLNTRLRHAGGRILLAPDIVVHYYPRGRLGEFVGRNLIDGFWALYPLRFGSRLARLRHLAPLACLLLFVLTVGVALADRRWWTVPAGLLNAYVLMSVGVAATVAARNRRPVLLVLLPLIFTIRHSAYAVGSLWGAVRALAGRGFWTRPFVTSPTMPAKP
jgi:glycosyltransferase involved in cell wall biosynthesis